MRRRSRRNAPLPAVSADHAGTCYFGDRTEWRFYEADFVKARCENSLRFIFLFVFTDIRQQLTSLALVLDHCSGVYAAMIKRQSQLLLPARNGIGSGEQRNKWQGPAVGGKDAVYAGCELEPMEWSATKAGDLLCS